MLYWFSIAVVTDCHKFSGLKQYKFIVLCSWRSEIQNKFHWDENQVIRTPMFLPEMLGESVFLPFSASKDYLHFLAHGPFFHLQSQWCGIFSLFWPLFLSLYNFLIVHFFLYFFYYHISFLSLILIRDRECHCLIILWLHWAPQDNLLISKPLMWSHLRNPFFFSKQKRQHIIGSGS